MGLVHGSPEVVVEALSWHAVEGGDVVVRLRSEGRAGRRVVGGEGNSDEVVAGGRRVRKIRWVERVGESSRVEEEHIGRRLRVGVRVGYIIGVHQVKGVNSVRIATDF